MPRVAVHIGSVHCIKTEDSGIFGSHDELYITGTIHDGRANHAVLTDKLTIDNGERRRFPNSELFSGSVAADTDVRISLVAYDSDSGSEWKSRRAMIDKAQEYIDEKLKGELPEGTIEDQGQQRSELQWIVQVGGEILQAIGEGDEDDRLGAYSVKERIPDVAVYENRPRRWELKEDGAHYDIIVQLEIIADNATPEMIREHLREMRERAKRRN